MEPGEERDDRAGDEAYDEHAARCAAYALHGPAGRLPEGGRGEDPHQDDELGAEQAFGRRDQRRDREEPPGLDQPGEVDRGEDQGAEVLGDGADRVDGRLAAREQLAAAAAAHRGTDGQQQEAGEGGAEVALEGRERPLERRGADGAQVDPRRRDGEDRGQHEHDGQAEDGRATTAYGPGAERHQVTGVAHRLEPGVLRRVSRGGHGRPHR